MAPRKDDYEYSTIPGMVINAVRQLPAMGTDQAGNFALPVPGAKAGEYRMQTFEHPLTTLLGRNPTGSKAVAKPAIPAPNTEWKPQSGKGRLHKEDRNCTCSWICTPYGCAW